MSGCAEISVRIIPKSLSGCFRKQCPYVSEICKAAFADVDTLYVTDAGEVFRFVLKTDDVDFDMVKKSAWENLNKMRNPLVKLDTALEIYTLKFTTDYNSTLLLSTALQNQICKKIGRDYLFAIPSATMLIVAKLRHEYIKIIESLIMIDNDPNKISDKIYRCKNGIFYFGD